MKTKVVCLEGIHGVGKTTLKRYIEESVGFPTVDEGFVGLCDSLGISEYEDRCDHMAIREAVWMCNWAIQVSKTLNEYDKTIGSENEKKRPRFIFCDRSPFSSFIYGKRNYGVDYHGLDINLDYSLLTLAADTVMEVERQCNVEVQIVYLQLSVKDGFDRVQHRLTLEPSRLKFNEQSLQHYMDCLYRYQFLLGLLDWPVVVITGLDARDIYKKIEAIIESKIYDEKSYLEYYLSPKLK